MVPRRDQSDNHLDVHKLFKFPRFFGLGPQIFLVNWSSRFFAFPILKLIRRDTFFSAGCPDLSVFFCVRESRCHKELSDNGVFALLTKIESSLTL